MSAPDEAEPQRTALRLRTSFAGAERSFALRPGPNRVGSGSANDVVLSVRGISKRHVLLTVGPDGVRIEDLGSRNGTLVNGARVERCPIGPGDEVRLGPVTLWLERAAEPPGEPSGEGPARQPGVAPALDLGVAPGTAPEQPRVAPEAAAAWAAAALVAQQVLAKATRDALFLTSFEASALPPAMIAASLLAVAGATSLSRALSRRSPARVASALLLGHAALLAAEWALCAALPRAVALVVFVHLGAAGGLLISCFWSVVNERFDPRAGRHVFGRIGTAASAGGLAGGALAWALAGHVPVPSMLLVTAALSVLGAVGIRSSVSGAPMTSTALGMPSLSQPSPGGLEGLRILGRVPYLRRLALLVLVVAALEALLDYGFKAQAAASLRPGADLLSFFGSFYTGVGLLALLLQGLLTRRCLESLGLAGSVALLPATVAAAAGCAAVFPQLATAALARGAHAVLQSSTYRSGYELFFTAIASAKKRPTKQIVDVGFDKLGAVLGAGLALVVIRFSSDPGAPALFVLAAAFGAAGLLLCAGLRRGYVEALAESLRAGHVQLDSSEITDSTTRLALAESGLPDAAATLTLGLAADTSVAALRKLRSGDAATIRAGLAQAEAASLLAHVIPLLARDDVARDALRVLRANASRTTGQIVDALLDLDQPGGVRPALARLLQHAEPRRAASGLRLVLCDPAFEVRRQAARSLVRLCAAAAAPLVPAGEAFAAAERELLDGARDEQRLRHVFDLLSLAIDAAAVRAAYRALSAEGRLRGTALEFLEHVLPDPLRRALWLRLGLASGGEPAAAAQAGSRFSS